MLRINQINSKLTNNEIVVCVSDYETFKKVSDFSNAIITNKSKQLGYLKFKQYVWLTLYAKHTKNKQTLQSLVRYGALRAYCQDHTQTIYSFEELSNNTDIDLDTIQCVGITFDVDKICKEICDTCFVTTPKKYALAYHENSIRNGLFSTLTFETVSNETLGSQLFPCDGGFLYINKTDSFHVSIVAQIINALVLDNNNTNNTVQKYRQFCYHTLCVESNTPIFFDDHYNADFDPSTSWFTLELYHSSECNSLKYWLQSVLNRLGRQYAVYFKGKLTFFNKSVHSSLNNRTCCLFVYTSISPKKLQTLIAKHSIKQIYMIRKFIDRTFDYDYDQCNSQIPNLLSTCTHIHYGKTMATFVSVKHVFYSSALLMNDYLKWCTAYDDIGKFKYAIMKSKLHNLPTDILKEIKENYL